MLVNILTQAGFLIRCVILTHSHVDHLGAAAVVGERAQCPVYMSEIEIEFSGFQCPQLMPFRDEAKFSAGSIEWTVIPTPGHTPGSVCIHSNGRLFTGDTLFVEGCGLARTPYGAGNTAALFDSLQRLRTTISADTLVYPGHRYRSQLGPTFRELMDGNFYMRLVNKEAFTRFCGRPGRDANLPPPVNSPLMNPQSLWLSQKMREHAHAQPLTRTA